MGKKIIYRHEFDYWGSLSGFFNVLKNEESHIDIQKESHAEIVDHYKGLWEAFLMSSEMIFVRNDLKLMVESEKFFFLVLEFLRNNTVQEVIDFSTDEFFQQSIELLDINDVKDKDDLYQKVKVNLDDNYNTSDSDYIMMKELIFNTKIIKERLNDVLSKTYGYFHDEIFTEENQKKAQEKLSEFQVQLDEDEGEFIKSITLLNTPEKDFIPEELSIYMTWFAPYSYTFMIKRLTLIFGVGIPEQIIKNNEKLDLESFLKVLADPTRYKMIKLLSNKAYYGAELARELGLSTATISHHMDKFLGLKITNTISGENNKLYIQVNKVDLESYLEGLKADLLG